MQDLKKNLNKDQNLILKVQKTVWDVKFPFYKILAVSGERRQRLNANFVSLSTALTLSALPTSAAQGRHFRDQKGAGSSSPMSGIVTVCTYS